MALLFHLVVLSVLIIGVVTVIIAAQNDHRRQCEAIMIEPENNNIYQSEYNDCNDNPVEAPYVIRRYTPEPS